jgi:hypothetical protein
MQLFICFCFMQCALRVDFRIEATVNTVELMLRRSVQRGASPGTLKPIHPQRIRDPFLQPQF